jgi:two-component system response regulator
MLLRDNGNCDCTHVVEGMAIRLLAEVGMRTVEVLMIEDDPADRFWLEYVLKSLRLNYSFSSVADGGDAVDFLLKRGKHAEALTPDLIFLDVHLPMLNGIEVLRHVPNARELPVCVLTSSEDERSLFQREFDIQDSNYLLKPVSQESLLASSCCQDHLKPAAS